MIINERDNLIVTDNVLTNLPISRLSSTPLAADGVRQDDLFLVSRACEPPAMTETGYMSYKADFGSLSRWMRDAFGLPGLSNQVDDLLLSVSNLNEFYDMLCKIRDACPSAVVDIYDEYEKFNPYVISAICTDAGTVISDLGGYRFADAMSNIFDWKKFSKISADAGYFGNIQTTGSINVNNLTAVNGVFQNLSATSRLSAANLKTTQLTATQLTVTQLTATQLTATQLTAASANITNLASTRLTATQLTATQLTAPSANITNLTAASANLTGLSVGGRSYQQLSVMAQSAYDGAVTQADYFYFTYPG